MNMDECVELIQVEKSDYVKIWEGPYYREPPTAVVKAPEPGPQDLRPKFHIQI